MTQSWGWKHWALFALVQFWTAPPFSEGRKEKKKVGKIKPSMCAVWQHARTAINAEFLSPVIDEILPLERRGVFLVFNRGASFDNTIEPVSAALCNEAWKAAVKRVNDIHIRVVVVLDGRVHRSTNGVTRVKISSRINHFSISNSPLKNCSVFAWS